MNYPHAVQGRVSEDTFKLIDQAIGRFKTTEGALVRAALEDYMPRFISNQGQSQHAELFAQLAIALKEKPAIELELKALARRSTRRARTLAVAQA